MGATDTTSGKTILACVILVGGVFTALLFTPLGTAVEVLYVAPVLLSLSVPQRRLTVICGMQTTDDGILIVIEDADTSFDPDPAKGGPGLGLISMKERVRLVSGRLSFRPNQTGTGLEVWAPLQTEVECGTATCTAGG
jgi:signal transduction histidine kinase